MTYDAIKYLIKGITQRLKTVSLDPNQVFDCSTITLFLQMMEAKISSLKLETY